MSFAAGYASDRLIFNNVDDRLLDACTYYDKWNQPFQLKYSIQELPHGVI